MQPRWMVIVKGRAVGEFASRNAAFVFAERLEGPYSILRGPARTSKSSAGKERHIAKRLRPRSKRCSFSDHIPAAQHVGEGCDSKSSFLSEDRPKNGILPIT